MRVFLILLAILFSISIIPHQAFAQADGDDSYDPFADYSEFEESSEEEADINYFRNGRFFNLGFLLGPQQFTGKMGDLYSAAPSYGMFITYFFDLRFALQFTFATSDHRYEMKYAGETTSGNVSLSYTSFDLKYYFNTQNVTRGLADLNPYILGGFSQNTRTFSIVDYESLGRDSASGVDIGGGIEIPMMRNKMYFGIQMMYHLVNFADENQNVKMPSSADTGIRPEGDVLEMQALLGINF